LPPPATWPGKESDSHVSKSSGTSTADAGSDTQPPTAPPDFEGSLAELETIVERLEQGELSLDESLQQFERGVQLTRLCQSALKQAEHKVEILLRKSGAPDEFEAAPFESADDDN
jgi:exodeoxyribonuclease VII small subunit